MKHTDPKRSRGRPKTTDAEAVLDVAINAYWQHDPADVSVNAICEMAGISKPSLYREFGGEDGLTCAALDRYARQVLSKVFTILQSGKGFRMTLDALIDFACDDPTMATGCLFYKMRAGRHRLGPKTQTRIEEITAAAQNAYVAFLQSSHSNDGRRGERDVEVQARYLGEQLALAFTQRASGEDRASVRKMLTLALSVLDRPE